MDASLGVYALTDDDDDDEEDREGTDDMERSHGDIFLGGFLDHVLLLCLECVKP